MLIDHIGAVIVENSTSQTLWDVDGVLRGIGRLAFPLFCFFIVEGFHYTHDWKKYAVRLAAFAVISEIPFNLAFNGTLLYPDYNNVMWTLLLGLLAIRGVRERQKPLYNIVAIAVVILAVVVLEQYVVKSDYGAAGVIAILIMYLAGRYRLVGFALAVFWLGFTCGHTEWLAFIDLLPLYFYHGRQGHRMKYFFYIFYPAHLLILTAIAHFAV